MMRVQHLKQLWLLTAHHPNPVIGSQGKGALLLPQTLHWPCAGCQIRRYQVSRPHHSSNKYMASIQKAFYKSGLRVMSSTSQDDSSKEPPVQSTESSQKSSGVDTILKVQPTLKAEPQRKKIDFTKSYYDNIYITPQRAIAEYLLDSGELDDLPRTKRRSPYPEKETVTVYLRRDVEAKALVKWGNMETIQNERKKILQQERRRNTYLFQEKKAKKEYTQAHYGQSEEKPFIFHPSKPHMGPESIFKSGPGKVVLYAIAVNGINCIVKFGAWLYTGSHSMFSEFIHSAADTANQVILAIGVHQSLKQADLEHPYGWMTLRNIASLISGVGIFCLGAGLSCYHGFHGLYHPQEIGSLYWAMAILTGSFVSEGATLLVAVNQIRVSAKGQGMGMIEYVMRGQDPSTNVVLLEDLAAVMGVVIALGCMGITHLTGHPTADAVGSLLIGSLLGGVASVIIYTNSIALVGRSIPTEKKQELMKELEEDRMIRALHDVKATDMGGSFVKFKAEVDFDGRELTRYYLEKQDLEILLKQVQEFQTIEEVESFLLSHGENIVDALGGEVDRIEKNLKKKHPEVRHVDLEQL